MPNLTVSNFGLQNSSPQFVNQVNSALAYLQTNPAASAILQIAADSHAQILNNTDGYLPYPESGADFYSKPSNMVAWNPNSALEVHDTNGTVTGVQSAALSLLHELIHSLDPNLMTNLIEPNSQYENNGEYVAVTIEGTIATQMGEPARDNHEGSPVTTDNPTTHTMQTEDGGMVWTQQTADGQTEYGPAYSYGQLGGDSTPEFGSTLVDGEDTSGHVYPDPTGGGDQSAGGGDTGGGGDEYAGGGGGDEYAGGGGDDGDAGCVAIESYLPDGRLAGDIKVGDTMELGDEDTLVAATGIVGYSQVKQAPGYRIITETGASLVCSDTAPIPARGKGLLTPSKLLGEEVAVRWDENGQNRAGWEKIVKVETVGTIKVQHITVGNKCFWAGEKKGASILHHNMKMIGGGGGDGGGGDWQWDWEDAATVQLPHNASPLNAQHADLGLAGAQVVGVPHPMVDGFGLV